MPFLCNYTCRLLFSAMLETGTSHIAYAWMKVIRFISTNSVYAITKRNIFKWNQKSLWTLTSHNRNKNPYKKSHSNHQLCNGIPCCSISIFKVQIKKPSSFKYKQSVGRLCYIGLHSNRYLIITIGMNGPSMYEIYLCDLWKEETITIPSTIYGTNANE